MINKEVALQPSEIEHVFYVWFIASIETEVRYYMEQNKHVKNIIMKYPMQHSNGVMNDRAIITRIMGIPVIYEFSETALLRIELCGEGDEVPETIEIPERTVH